MDVGFTPALHVRGPQDAPSFSGRTADAPSQHLRSLRRSSNRYRRVNVTASSQVRVVRESRELRQAAPAGQSKRAQKLKEGQQYGTGFPNDKPSSVVRVTEVDELNDDDASSGAETVDQNQPLAINLDLSLWRHRQQRIQSNFMIDVEKRKRALQESEEGLRKCISQFPGDARAYVTLGKMLVKQRRWEEARRLYAEGCQNTGSNNPYLWCSWGYLEAKMGETAKARKLFDAAVVVDETHACAWHMWGTLEKSEGNYLKARDLWSRGIQKCRKNVDKHVPYLYCSLGVMAAELGRIEEARAWFEEGTRMRYGITSHALWHAWAMVEARQGDETAVRYLFKRSLQANSKSRYTHLAWALWERRQGNTMRCIQLLRRGQGLNPTDPALYQAWGLVEAEQGNHEQARGLFEQGLKVDRAHLYLWQAWGFMEQRLNNVDRARELYQQGVWADPGNKDVVYIFHAWGTLEKSAGNYTTARELFKAALKVNPRNDRTWDRWIEMEDEIGEKTRADELKIRRAEQQWEFVIPSTFTTRPENAPVTRLLESLNKFFSSWDVRARAPVPTSRPLQDLLPADFRQDLSLEELFPDILGPSKKESGSVGAEGTGRDLGVVDGSTVEPEEDGVSSSGSSRSSKIRLDHSADVRTSPGPHQEGSGEPSSLHGSNRSGSREVDLGDEVPGSTGEGRVGGEVDDPEEVLNRLISKPPKNIGFGKRAPKRPVRRESSLQVPGRGMNTSSSSKQGTGEGRPRVRVVREVRGVAELDDE